MDFKIRLVAQNSAVDVDSVPLRDGNEPAQNPFARFLDFFTEQETTKQDTPQDQKPSAKKELEEAAPTQPDAEDQLLAEERPAYVDGVTTSADRLTAAPGNLTQDIIDPLQDFQTRIGGLSQDDTGGFKVLSALDMDPVVGVDENPVASPTEPEPEVGFRLFLPSLFPDRPTNYDSESEEYSAIPVFEETEITDPTVPIVTGDVIRGTIVVRGNDAYVFNSESPLTRLGFDGRLLAEDITVEFAKTIINASNASFTISGDTLTLGLFIQSSPEVSFLFEDLDAFEQGAIGAEAGIRVSNYDVTFGDDHIFAGDFGITVAGDAFNYIESLASSSNITYLNDPETGQFFSDNLISTSGTNVVFGSNKIITGAGNDDIYGNVALFDLGLLARDITSGLTRTQIQFGDPQGDPNLYAFGDDEINSGAGIDTIFGDSEVINLRASAGNVLEGSSFFFFPNASANFDNTLITLGADNINAGADGDFVYGDAREFLLELTAGTNAAGTFSGALFRGGSEVVAGSNTIEGGSGFNTLIGSFGNLDFAFEGGNMIASGANAFAGMEQSEGFTFQGNTITTGDDGSLIVGHLDNWTMNFTAGSDIGPGANGAAGIITDTVFLNFEGLNPTVFDFQKSTLTGGQGSDEIIGDIQNWTLNATAGSNVQGGVSGNSFTPFIGTQAWAGIREQVEINLADDHIVGNGGLDFIYGDVQRTDFTFIAGQNLDPNGFTPVPFGGDPNLIKANTLLPEFAILGSGYTDPFTGQLNATAIATASIDASAVLFGPDPYGTANSLDYGDDELHGGSNTDVIYGDSRIFSVFAQGGQVNTSAMGAFVDARAGILGGVNAGHDTIFGYDGNDIIYGDFATIDIELIDGIGREDFDVTYVVDGSTSFISENQFDLVGASVGTVTLGNNIIDAGEGENQILGNFLRASETTTIHRSGDNMITAGGGSDIIFGDGRNLSGTLLRAGDDTITDSQQAIGSFVDTFISGDLLEVRNGATLVQAGHDIINFTSNLDFTTPENLPQRPIIIGDVDENLGTIENTGHDEITVTATGADIIGDVGLNQGSLGILGNDVIRVTGNNNIIIGDVARNALSGTIEKLGNDEIWGGDGDDTIYGDIEVNDNTSKDFNPSGGNDIINAGAGDDVIFADYGRDTIDAGADDDIILIQNKDFISIDGGAGSDLLYITQPLSLDTSSDSLGDLLNIESIVFNYTPTEQDLSLVGDLGLTRQSVIDMTDEDNALFISLIAPINNGPTSVVRFLDSGWELIGSNGSVDTYQNNGAFVGVVTQGVTVVDLTIVGNGEDNNGTIEFFFTQAPTGFDVSDISIENGTIDAGSFMQSALNPLLYTITVTPDFPQTASNVAVTVAAGGTYFIDGEPNNFASQNVTHLDFAFQNGVISQPDVSGLNTSNVTSMEGTFLDASTFNEDISDWDTSNVTSMFQMFADAEAFNQDIGGWKVGKVTDMSGMFFDAVLFNQDISGWDVGNVQDMSSMFSNADAFVADIGGWDTSNVLDMSNMFFGARLFNSDIGAWDVSNVIKMNSTFAGTAEFNQDIGDWDVGNVTEMSLTFSGTSAFNQDISNWDVSNVTNMAGMFQGAVQFNQDISAWDTSNVRDMSGMFSNAGAFDQDIGSWDISSLITAQDIFNDARAFSTENYDKLLAGWSVIDTEAGETNINSGVLFGGVSLLGLSNVTYTDATARQELDDTYGWMITDDGVAGTVRTVMDVTGATILNDVTQDGGQKILAIGDNTMGDMIDASVAALPVLLHGLGGNDTLIGSMGNDTLYGGQGDDTLTSGIGSDVFIYRYKTEGNDTITDFNTIPNALGIDVLDLSDLLQGATIDNLDDYINVTLDNGNTRLDIEADLNDGVNGPDISITLENVTVNSLADLVNDGNIVI